MEEGRQAVRRKWRNYCSLIRLVKKLRHTAEALRAYAKLAKRISAVSISGCRLGIFTGTEFFVRLHYAPAQQGEAQF